MPTTVHLTTHAWPVEVTTIDQYGDRDAEETKDIVPPGASRPLYLTSTRSLHLRELPAPEQAVVPEQAEPVVPAMTSDAADLSSEAAEPPLYTA